MQRVLVATRLAVVFALLVVVCSQRIAAEEAAAKAANSVVSPVSAEESLQHFVLADDELEIQLVAAEPEVVDPVAIRFDEDGRLWVVEMRDYPHGPKEGERPQSQIKVLEDRDGDGRFERATTFADGLLFATGIQPWRGGVFVTLAGKVIYLKDIDSDGRADQEESWFTGFAQENSQLRANHPTLALDGRVYVAGGLRGGSINSARDEMAKPVSISNRDFAFDPRTTAFEAVSGNGQYGLTLDDYGRRFVCMNARPIDHVVLEERYAGRNPHVAITNTVDHLVPAERKVYPLVNQVTTAASHEGQFTAACGIHVLRGEALGPVYRGNVFVCEPTGSLVHREVLEPRGVTFDSRTGDDGRSFLTSRDSWFRPVDLIDGPDGALYVADMYRAVIEHPDWVPPEDRNPKNLRDGDDRGRIYRIVRRGGAKAERPQLSKATTTELVNPLGERTEGWWQDTIHRLLLERGDPQTGKLLRKLKPKSAIAQIRVLWLLAQLNELEEEHLVDALMTAEPRVVEHAIQLAEPRLASSEQLRRSLYSAAESGDARLRFRVALALGKVRDSKAAEQLAALVERDGGDRWIRAATLSSMRRHAGEVLLRLAKHPPADDEARRWIVEVIAKTAIAEGAHSSVADGLSDLLSADRGKDRWIARRVLLGAAAANAGQSDPPGKAFQSLVRGDGELSTRIRELTKECRVVALDESTPAIDGQEAIRLLVFDADDPTETLLTCFRGDATLAIRSEALQALARRGDATSWQIVLIELPRMSPPLRRSALELSIGDEAKALMLLTSIEKGGIDPAHLDTVYAKRLFDHRSANVRDLAKQVLPLQNDAVPAEVLGQYRAALVAIAKPAGSAVEVKLWQSGRLAYEKHCAVCHRLGASGSAIGPNLSDARMKTPEQLLEAILQPNDAIDANYVAYSATTKQGQVLTGVIVGESGSGVTLRLADGKGVTLARSELESLESTGVSLMPAGMERTLKPEEMAELVWYMRNWRNVGVKSE